MEIKAIKSCPIAKDLDEANALIKLLFEHIQILQAEIKELKEKLNTNSNNSSTPPSQDRKKKSANKKSSRKRGGQPGHKGVNRKLLPPEKVDFTVLCMPDTTCDCGDTVEVKDDFHRHQVYEIPPQHFEVTEYQIFKGICCGCGKKYKGNLPEGVSFKGIGFRALSLIGLLTSKFRLSKRQAVDLFSDIYGMKISLGSLSNAEKIVSESLKNVHEQIHEILKNSPVLHADETGYKQNNRNGWAWICGNNKLTAFLLRRSRGKKIAQELLGNPNNKILISDRYPVYNIIATERRQICWAHLKRDFQKIADREETKILGTRLLITYRKIFEFWKTEPRGKWVYNKKCRRNLNRLKKKLMTLLEAGTHCGHKKTMRTCENILEMGPALWNFFDKKDVPPTNNQAERQIRPLVILKKLSFGTQSDRGSRFIERIFTVTASCKQQKIDIFKFIQEAIFSFFSGKQGLTISTIA